MAGVGVDDIAKLLSRSYEYAELLRSIAYGVTTADVPRLRATANASSMSIEHAYAVRVLFANGAPVSACALLRVQYEALVRSAWAMYAANDVQIERLNAPLTIDAETAAKNLRGAQDMLSDLQTRSLEVSGLVPLVAPLVQIRDQSWRAMNSYVHGGIHPLQRAGEGFPVELAANVVRNSNGMMQFAYGLLVRLDPNPALAAAIHRAYLGFEDCVPMA